MKTKSNPFIFTALFLLALPTINFAQTQVLNQPTEIVNTNSITSQFTSSTSTNAAYTKNGTLTIGKSAVFTIGKNAALITNSNINNIGTLSNQGSLILNGDTTQMFPGLGGSIPFMNKLEFNNTGTGVILNQHLRIDKELKLRNGKLSLGNYDITIKSMASQTAAVSAMGAGASVEYGTGRFIVERFINLGNNGHNKSWQFLAVPAVGQTIRNTWQESGAATVGYGTQITGPYGIAGGYDVYSSTPSLKTYVSATNSYDQGPSSTSSLINNPKGYMLFVRGDRTVASGNGTSPTTLRVKGTLFTPQNPPTTINVASAKFESVGNPYASQIDFTQLSITGGVDNTFYTWDPNLVGMYGLGGYQTMSATNSWIPVPGGGNYTGVHKTIESGQAFFVRSTSVAGTISFSENVKTGSSKLVNRNFTDTSYISRQAIQTSLLTNSGILADGNSAVFSHRYGNEIDGNDAIKIMNGGENFGINRDGKIFAVEARGLITHSDTIFYFISRLRQQPYRFLFEPENMDVTKAAWLVDNYLNTQTVVSTSNPTKISFVVTNDPLSAVADRFMLVFRPQSVLGITSTALEANRNTDGSIKINWTTTVEKNVQQYTVEKSINNIAYKEVTIKNIVSNNEGTVNYGVTDVNPFDEINYYRIKINSLNGEVNYSNIVKVDALKKESAISLYPNPVTGKTLNIYFKTTNTGNYQVALVNKVGQKIWSGSFYNNNNNDRKISVILPKSVAPGSYVLLLSDKTGKEINLPFILL